MDLFKVFGNLNHETLLAKLKACDLEYKSVTFMKNYSTNSP